MNNLEKRYRTEVIPKLKQLLGYKNDLAVPRLVKVIINIGIGSGARDEKSRTAASETLKRISGQKPVLNLAKKSISSFKIRRGMPVGVSVTLRKKRMYDFVDKLINVTLPRVRDFRGLNPKSFDGRGNYSLGFREHNVFPEIKSDEVENIHGLELAIVTSAESDNEALKLLELLGFPFKKED